MSRRNSRPEKLRRKAEREARQAERDAHAYLVEVATTCAPFVLGLLACTQLRGWVPKWKLTQVEDERQRFEWSCRQQEDLRALIRMGVER